MNLPTDRFWSDFRAVASGVTIVGLLAWVMLNPHEKPKEKSCTELGGVVAYTVLKNEPVCVKEKK